MDNGEKEDEDSGSNGHSTHTAIIIISKFSSSSKQATLISVRVGGTTSVVKPVRAIDLVRRHIPSDGRAKNSVVSMLSHFKRQFDLTKT